MFEWDTTKNEANIMKHGIDFEDVQRIFEGRLIQKQDTRKDYGEVRVQAIGELEGVLFTVVYTLRNGNIRIISARRANKLEKELYYGQY